MKQSINLHALPPLHAAIRSGDTLEFYRQLASGADVNQKAIFGLTPLHIASMSYAAQRYGTRLKRDRLNMMCAELLNRGANIRARNFLNLTPAGAAEGDICPSLRQAEVADADKRNLVKSVEKKERHAQPRGFEQNKREVACTSMI